MIADRSGTVQIDKLELISHTGEKYELSGSMVSVDIFEDIFSNTLSGTLSLMDTLYMPMYLPILGNEKVNIDFTLPTATTPGLTYTFVVNSLMNRTRTTEGTYIFQLSLISELELKNAKTKISKAYDDLNSAVIEELYNEISTDKSITVEESMHNHAFIVPNMSPFKAINWLANSSIGSEMLSPTYLFFERQDEFWCKSLDAMMMEEPVGTYKIGNKDLRANKERAAKETNAEQFMIDQFFFDTQFNILENMMGGMYGSKLLTHDIHRKVYKTYDYKYSDDFVESTHVKSEMLTGDIVGENKVADELYDNGAGENLSQMMFVPTHDDHDLIYAAYPSDNDDRYVEDWILRRKGRLQEFSNIKVGIEVPGTIWAHVGDMLEVEIPVIEGSNTNDAPGKDIYYSGTFLVSAMRHHINKEEFKTSFELISDSLGDIVPAEPNYLG